MLDRGELSPKQIFSFERDQFLDWHHTDPDRIATFWAKDTPADPAAWMETKRALGRKFVGEFVRVKPHILKKVDAFWDEWIRPQVTLGVHIRGTDFSYAEPTSPQAYFDAIDRYVAASKINNYRIFLATDQVQFVDIFHNHYGERVLTYDCLRSNSDQAAFKFSWESPYRRGEDVLVDVLLLSRTDFIFKGAAAAGECALWFNPKLQCHDFALQSAFEPRKNGLVSAYQSLGLCEMGNPPDLLARSTALTASEARAKSLEADLSARSEALTAMYASNSLRITAPLRRARRAARWFVRGSCAWLTLRPGSRLRRVARRFQMSFFSP